MKNKTWLILFPLLFTFSLFANPSLLIKNDEGTELHLDFLSQESERKVQILWAKPQGEGPFPLLIFLHGASAQAGAMNFSSHIQEWVEKNVMCAAVSLPGFGLSSGPKDFAGKSTQLAMKEAIAFFRKLDQLDAERIGLCGYGIGAVAALLSAANEPGIVCVVSANGCYDLMEMRSAHPQWLHNVSALNHFEPTDEQLILRSPIFHLQNIACPMLLLHREKNPHVQLEQVFRFCQKAAELGKICDLIVAPDGEIEEKIPQELIKEQAVPFLYRNLIGDIHE